MQISIANIIRGTLIGNTMSVLTRYISRVVNDGGVVEVPRCVETALNSQGLLQQASLLVVPSGYKGGRLYSQIPTNGNGDLTWSRASDAFRTNASGLIQRVPWNLLQQSETFANVAWTAGNSTITANTTNAPNGTLTADTIASTTIGSETRIRQTIVQGANITFTLSCYAKNSSVNWFIVRNLGVNATAGRAWFNLNTGTIGTVNSGLTASIENVGDGWYRCSVTGVSSGSGNLIDLAPALSDGAINATSVGESVFIWGAQIVEGTTAQTYLPTTDRLNFPRLSYMYGSCPSVLLEPQRTNFMLWSEDFSNVWTKVASSITTNTTTSPDGNTNADSLIENSAIANHEIVQTFSVTNGVAYTFSIYIKANGRDKLKIQLSNQFSATALAYYDTATNTTYSVGASATASIQSVGSGWYRCTITSSATSTGTAIVYSTLVSTGITTTYLGNGTSGLFIYGAQLEVGAYPTTYIPTTSATATRVADSFSRGNIFTNGLITSSGGTWFVELRGNISYVRDASSRIGFGDTSNLQNNSFFLNPQFGGGRFLIFKSISNSLTPLFTTTTDTIKVAIKWNGTTADVFVNGTKQVSATAFATTNMGFLYGDGVGVPAFIQQMALYPSPLSDTDCTTITTL